VANPPYNPQPGRTGVSTWWSTRYDTGFAPKSQLIGKPNWVEVDGSWEGMSDMDEQKLTALEKELLGAVKDWQGNNERSLNNTDRLILNVGRLTETVGRLMLNVDGLMGVIDAVEKRLAVVESELEELSEKGGKRCLK
jgi:hypothetical protein